MLSVKQVADLTGITVKTLYHYHKIGLLEPTEVSEAGYRLYGKKELERLQHILFYRELDFSLKTIQKILRERKNRYQILMEQKELMEKEKGRINLILTTLRETIHFEKSGKEMKTEDMFKGLNIEQWKDTMKEQTKYLRENYDIDIPVDFINGDELEESARESQEFMDKMVFALKEGWAVDDERVKLQISNHINSINKLSYIRNNIDHVDAQGFVESIWFMVTDEWHRNMLEEQQIGLSYFLYAAAVHYAQETWDGRK